ncbi:MAG: hypothetical protein ACOC0D_04415 [Spirochaeta sp.]
MRHPRREMIVLVATGIVTLLFMVGMQMIAYFPTPDMEMLPDAGQIMSMHSAMDAREMTLYRFFRMLDMFFPLAYGSFLILSLRRLQRRWVQFGPQGKDRESRPGWMRLLMLLPVIGVLGDYAENILLMVTLAAHPEASSAAAAVGIANLVKWIGLLLTPTAAAGLAVAVTIRRRRKPV